MVSDFTCETVCAIYRSVFAQFPEVDSKDYIWPLVGNEKTIDKLVASAKKKSGIILHTINNEKLTTYLENACEKNQVIQCAALSQVIDFVGNFLHSERVQNNLYEFERTNYYQRINAIEFTLNHDDGQLTSNLHKANIIIVGVSRTSKSPTSIYLAYRGYKVINIPFIFENPLPEELFVKNLFVVGLTINPEILLDIRKKRLIGYKQHVGENKYTSYEEILQEIRAAKKIFNAHHWPVIDVTKRSVEETASMIIKFYQKRKK